MNSSEKPDEADKNTSKGYLSSDSISTSWFAPDIFNFISFAAFSDNADAFTVFVLLFPIIWNSELGLRILFPYLSSISSNSLISASSSFLVLSLSSSPSNLLLLSLYVLPVFGSSRVPIGILPSVFD